MHFSDGRQLVDLDMRASPQSTSVYIALKTLDISFRYIQVNHRDRRIRLSGMLPFESVESSARKNAAPPKNSRHHSLQIFWAVSIDNSFPMQLPIRIQ
jgi:predicted transport protein